MRLESLPIGESSKASFLLVLLMVFTCRYAELGRCNRELLRPGLPSRSAKGLRLYFKIRCYYYYFVLNKSSLSKHTIWDLGDFH